MFSLPRIFLTLPSLCFLSSCDPAEKSSPAGPSAEKKPTPKNYDPASVILVPYHSHQNILRTYPTHRGNLLHHEFQHTPAKTTQVPATLQSQLKQKTYYLPRQTGFLHSLLPDSDKAAILYLPHDSNYLVYGPPQLIENFESHYYHILKNLPSLPSLSIKICSIPRDETAGKSWSTSDLDRATVLQQHLLSTTNDGFIHLEWDTHNQIEATLTRTNEKGFYELKNFTLKCQIPETQLKIERTSQSILHPTQAQILELSQDNFHHYILVIQVTELDSSGQTKLTPTL
ncbi:hypothetical protein [Rubritalea tangerina]|uniref:Lipoprotein n=1 Tax=Rubritalea tangerina TaxID=430798 RepID=A0ABW4ZF96_9BACT